MMRKPAALLLAIIMLISFSACKNNEPEVAEFGWGTTEDTVYSNEFFNFTIDLPDGFYFMTPQEIMDMNTEPDENGEINPININEIEDLSEEALVHFVYASQYETPPLGYFNPYINIFSENMAFSNNLYSKEDYVENNMRLTSMLFESGGVDVKVFPLEKPWFSERQFAKGTMQIDYDQFTMKQEMFVITKSNYAFVILIGYTTNTEKELLYSALESITIE
jgi:hypothetical protein